MPAPVCLITGANSGIGRAAALGLARQGFCVIMVCRDTGRGEAARAEIVGQSGNPDVDLLIADLASQASIRALAVTVQKHYLNLEVLVNNAGVAKAQRVLSEDGLETTFAVNHLAPFLLTNLLLPTLKASAPARIVNVTSVVHRWGRLDFDDLQGKKHYDMDKAYNQSKFANVLFTYALARRLKDTGVTVNSLEPGMTATNFAREYRSFKRLMTQLWRPFMKTPERASEAIIYLASSEEVEGVSGKYFAQRRPVKSSKASYDLALASKLWTVSLDLTGLNHEQEGLGESVDSADFSSLLVVG